MSADSPGPVDPALSAAVEARDAAKLRELILDGEFILINIQSDEEDDDDEEAMGALTAEIDELPALVTFTSERHAGAFVGAMGDLFEDSEEVQGFLVDGDALLEYLPEDYGLLVNPETDSALVIDATLAAEVNASTP